MAYRNIEVDGKKYKYKVGKSYTYIMVADEGAERRASVYRNEVIGEYYDLQCECCGISAREIGNWEKERLDAEPNLGRELRVTPKHIRKTIQECFWVGRANMKFG